jgi:hypothetical protein
VPLQQLLHCCLQFLHLLLQHAVLMLQHAVLLLHFPHLLLLLRLCCLKCRCALPQANHLLQLLSLYNTHRGCSC